MKLKIDDRWQPKYIQKNFPSASVRSKFISCRLWQPHYSTVFFNVVDL